MRTCEVSTLGPSTLAKRRTVTVVSGCLSAKSAIAASASTMSRSIGVRGGWRRGISSVKKAGSSCSQPYQWAELLTTRRRTGESRPVQAARMLSVPITLFSCASAREVAIGSTTRRVSITVSISAALTIRWISECWVPTLTNSVRSSSRVGSRESTPMIVSISGNDSSAWARRPPQ